MGITEPLFLLFLHCSGDDQQKTSAEFKLIACDRPDIFQRMSGLLTGNGVIQCCTDTVDIRSLADHAKSTGIRCLRRCHGIIRIASRGCRVLIGHCISIPTQGHCFRQRNRFRGIRGQVCPLRACVLLRCRITRCCTNRQHTLRKYQ